MTAIDQAPAKRLLDEIYAAGFSARWRRGVLAALFSPEGLHPINDRGPWRARRNYVLLMRLGERLRRAGYTVKVLPSGRFDGSRAVITAYAPPTPKQLATRQLTDTLCMYYNVGFLAPLARDASQAETADWIAGATTAELRLATQLTPTFSGSLAELLAVAGAMCAAPFAATPR